MDAEKLTKWSKEIYENAAAHGWHEEKHSPEHYLGLIMTEVAEAVEADRKNRYCGFVNLELLDQISDFGSWYRGGVKGTVDEEFADIVIRLLDMAVELYGDFKYLEPYKKIVPSKTLSLVENLWFFVKNKLYHYQPQISEAIVFIYDLAGQLHIDLDQHIEWKMRYNSLREYKHGGKKY